MIIVSCDPCGGTGRVGTGPCMDCGGAGVLASPPAAGLRLSEPAVDELTVDGEEDFATDRERDRAIGL